MTEISTRNGWQHALAACLFVLTAVFAVKAAPLSAPVAWTPEPLLSLPGGDASDDALLPAAEDADATDEEVQWIEVTLEEGGQLIRKLLSNPLVDQVQDIENLRVIGPLADDDWNAIAAMVKLLRADFSQARFKVLPAVLSKTLTEVSLPEGLEEIGDMVFWEGKISTITIPSTVKRIGDGAFGSAYDSYYEYRNKAPLPLKEVVFLPNSSLQYIGSSAFQNTSIESIDIPDAVTEIKAGAFSECPYLTRIKFGKNLLIIPRDCCSNYAHTHNTIWSSSDASLYSSRLTSVEFPPKLSGINAGAFQCCVRLTEINLPEGLSFIGSSAFNACAIKTLVIPPTVNTIYDAAFSGCSLLSSITLPEKMSMLESDVFAYCPLTTLELPKQIGNLAPDCLQHCDSLECITLPSNYTGSIGGLLYYQPSLTKIICPSPTVPLGEPVTSEQLANITLVVPDFAYEDYRFDKFWFAAKEIITDEAVSHQDKWYLNSSLTLTEGHRMGGTPDIEINTGGSVKISGETPQAFDKFSIYLGLNDPGQFYSTTNAVTANELELNMEVTSRRWTFFTPTADVRVADISHSEGAPFAIRYYDGESRAAANSASGNWKDVTDEYLHRGQGYIVQANADGWMRFPVAEEHHQQFFGNAELSIPLTEAECETTANANWNYIGNGYPTWFDIYYLNVDAPITVWTGSTYRALSLSDDEYALRPMQGFFVQKSLTNDSAVMLEQGRQLTSTISHEARSAAPVRRVADTERHRYDFAIQADGDTAAHDMTRVVLNERATLRYDASRDAAKFMTLSQDVAQIFTIDAEDTQLAINERPLADGEVRLGVLTPEKGAMYTISALRADGQVYLHDALTGLEYDLTAAPFCFTAAKSGLDTERFTLRFSPAESGIAGIASDTAISVKGVRGAIESVLPEHSEANVYTLQGIKAGTLSGNDRIAVPAGVYIVTIGDETRKVTVK